MKAHAACNSAASADEEYVRDLLIQEAVANGMPDLDSLNDKVWRSWAKGGHRRYQEIIRTAVPAELYSKAGLYTGRAIAVRPNHDIIRRVCTKIVRGIIFHDSGAVVAESQVHCVPIQVDTALRERSEHPDVPFWQGMVTDTCLHDMFGHCVALRRFYEGVADGPAASDIQIVGQIGVILWNLFAVSTTVFPLKSCNRSNFGFHVNTANDTWQKTTPG
ncbi:MAG: hypothetical protein INR62_02620 [Rhodospirillales bacterium]|nr:hypothetical protein [Acetobacter sp.]